MLLPFQATLLVAITWKQIVKHTENGMFLLKIIQTS